MTIDVTSEIDVTGLVQNTQADATDVLDPINDFITLINNIANAARDVDGIRFTDAPVIAISGGTLTPTTYNNVRAAAESGIADFLDNITIDDGRFVALTADTGDTITIRHNQGGTGNIRTFDGNSLDFDDSQAVLVWRMGSLVFVIGGGGGSSSLDAAQVTYTPSDNNNWTGNADPGDLDDALNQLADRLAVVEGGGGGGGAPDNATYITQTPSAGLSAEQALSALATGIMKSTTTTGVISIAAKADIDSTMGSQTANRVYAAPDGSPGNPDFRALVAADLPSHTQDASTITYTPSVATDWDGDADPGDLDDALNQLAERVDDLEGAGGGSTSYAIIADVKAQNTAGGASAATTWTARVLNTEIADADSIVSLASNRFTLVAGTYELWTDQSFRGGASNSLARSRIWNYTQSSEVARSTNVSFITSNNWGGSVINGARIVANGTDEFELQYYIGVARATDGLGVALNVSGESEMYSRIYIKRLN